MAKQMNKKDDGPVSEDNLFSEDVELFDMGISYDSYVSYDMNNNNNNLQYHNLIITNIPFQTVHSYQYPCKC